MEQFRQSTSPMIIYNVQKTEDCQNPTVCSSSFRRMKTMMKGKKCPKCASGRKPREMKATCVEMELADLEIGLRDDCAKLAIQVARCQREHDQQFGIHYCYGLHHKWTDCLRLYEDHLIRMKEYERELFRHLHEHQQLRKEKQQKAE